MRFELIPTDFSTDVLHTVGYTISSPKFERTNFYFLHPPTEAFFGCFIKNTGIILEYIYINGISPLIKIDFQHSILEDMLYWSTVDKIANIMKFPYFMVDKICPDNHLNPDPMQKILLPTDFSDNAWNAIFTAIKLYPDVKCNFYILHAYEPQLLNMLDQKSQQRLGVLYDSMAQYSKQELEKILGYINENYNNPNHNFEIISKSETLEKAVMEILSTEDMDLIVMGTQGATGSKEIFMGSNTVKILNKIKNFPVLVVPSDYNFQGLKTLAFPTDFSRTYKKFELTPLTELAALWKAEIQILYVAVEFILNDSQVSNRKILGERLADLNYCFQNVKSEGKVSNSIEKYLAENSVDFMVMVRYHHGFWEKVIGEPVVKKMAFHSKVSVLMLPEQQ